MNSGLRMRGIVAGLAACCFATGAWATSLVPEPAQAGPAYGQPARAAEAAQTSAPAARAITLAPHITELIFRPRPGDKLVGTGPSSGIPPAAKAIPPPRGGLNGKLEKHHTPTP